MHRDHSDRGQHARDRRLTRREALSSSLVAATLAASCKRSQDGPLVLAVSSSLSELARSELDRCSAPHARGASVVDGATSTLVRQIIAGAPFDLLVAADEGPLASAHARAALSPPRRFAEGVVALAVARSAALQCSLEALLDPAFARVALPNPETAPFGRAAREALVHRGLWDRVSSRILLSDNVRHALTLLERGEVDAAFTARSLLVTRSSQSARWREVPRAYHRPLTHLVALTSHAQGQRRASAEAFARQLEALAPERLRAFGMDPPR